MSSRTLWTPIGFTPDRNEFPSMYLQETISDKSLNSIQKRQEPNLLNFEVSRGTHISFKNGCL